MVAAAVVRSSWNAGVRQICPASCPKVLVEFRRPPEGVARVPVEFRPSCGLLGMFRKSCKHVAECLETGMFQRIAVAMLMHKSYCGAMIFHCSAWDRAKKTQCMDASRDGPWHGSPWKYCCKSYRSFWVSTHISSKRAFSRGHDSCTWVCLELLGRSATNPSRQSCA